jgi:hypothetical protein
MSPPTATATDRLNQRIIRNAIRNVAKKQKTTTKEDGIDLEVTVAEGCFLVTDKLVMMEVK